MAIPAVTLTAKLEDFIGSAVGSVANPAKMCVALCGFGPELPRIAGTALIARPGPIYIESTDGNISTTLWGNDVITPQNTYYTISLLDGQGNVVQCAGYQLTGTGTFDLSALLPIQAPFGFPIGNLVYQPCTRVSAVKWTAPGPVLAVSYNGVLMPEGVAFPTNSYTLDADNVTINLNFTSDSGDRIDAFCVL